MTVNERLISAVTPIVSVCVPNDYAGDATDYCVFRYDDAPDVFADGKPDVIRHPVIMDRYVPKGQNPLQSNRRLCNAIFDAGFTYPYITNVSDSVAQHYVFEFENVVGASDG